MAIRYIAPFLAGFILSCASALSQVPSDTEIRKILADRVGAENNGIGIVVGVVTSPPTDDSPRATIASSTIRFSKSVP